jgi:Spy/CpxP family protein refolding chaperone
MKRAGMFLVIGVVCLSVSLTSAWAQNDATASAKAQADEAKARVKADQAAVNARAAELRQQTGANIHLDLQKSLTAPGPLQGVPFPTVSGYNFRYISPSGASDPIAALQVAQGTWWNNMDTATRLSLTKDQQKKMDDIFQQFRLKLIDLNAALSKEELIMDPLMSAEKLDDVKILTQIDRIAQARAELEKANSRMLLGIRESLTMEQWTKIQSSPGTFRVVTPRR